ncbi:MAG: imidazolonepropionase [Wenzhouxiangella sp.]|nr:MAG: imidazolonepropionase [Wenzhouxiangella sp.]
MITKHSAIALSAALLGLGLLLSGPIRAELTALVGATVHPVSSEAIEHGVVLIEDGLILAVGADLEIPEQATIVDLDGLHLYPGFVHPGTQLGLTEISSVAGTVDTAEMGSINAAVRVEVAFNHDSELLPTSIAGGVLHAHVVPAGGLIRGTSAIMRLDGWSWEEMVVHSPAAMHMAFPPGAASDEDNEDLALINETLEQARHWHAAEQAAERGEAARPPRNDQLQALGPLLAGEVALAIHANGIDVIEAALDWAEQQQFEQLILVANADVQYAAERLAGSGTAVILRGVHSLPVRRWEPYDMAFVAAARLHDAGVQFAISDSGGGMDVANARNLPFHAGSAAAHGLARDAALKSVTLWPAEILGVGDRLGSIEPGKQASLFASTNDPLEPMTQIQHVWIDGVEYDLTRDRGRRLYERYRARTLQAR